MMPWADGLFAMDLDWWKKHIDEVNKSFRGQRFSNNKMPINYNVTQLKDLIHYGNSGAGAIAVALAGGAKRIILLGYDCQRTNNMAHWHGDHPKGLGNARMMNKWPEKFAEMALANPNKIYNASRETALNCFEKVKLENEIA